MQPLTVDDLLPLEEYTARRREFFDSHRHYIDHYRRVRIGPRLTLIFENRRTLWFRVQEIVRIACLAEPAEVQLELDLYNRLLPDCQRLQAALLIDISEDTELTSWRELRGDHLRLHLGVMLYSAQFVTRRTEDRAIGTAHWVQFPLDDQAMHLLASMDAPAQFIFDNGSYHHQSGPLSEPLRLSLVEDLHLPKRDETRIAA